ncbi:CYTH domain-containing protein [Clostridium putrefaciens]|nr:CYTH domain-containing protein [Clostridium putrefaciens]
MMSSLISSQLDADRLDYLLRDSLNSGVKFGNIDISRIIKSMGITIYKENLYVCIGDKYLPDIEAYLLSRFQMHESIYFHDNKCEMELIIEKIFMRIEELYNLGELTGIVPKELIPILKKEEMNIKDYIELDDYMMISLFKSLYKVEDNVLKELCAAILYRKKYKRVEIMDNGFGYVDKFKLNLVKLLNKYNYRVKDMEKEYFWLEKDIKNVMYKNNKENIWIISTNGIVSDISQISNLVNVRKEKRIHFISYDILYNLIPYEQLELFKNELKQIMDSYNSRNHIEIESKYLIPKELKEDIIISLEETDKYKISNKTKVTQMDIYYDTNDFKLLKKKISLRMREIDNKYYLTVKLPTVQDVNERFEYEFLVNDKNLINNLYLFDEYLDLDILKILKNTKPVLNIINEREKYDIYEKDSNIIGKALGL